jgi:hypothetical protein
VRLTTTEMSLIAAGIALAAPLITYRASARLDRNRWVRERRAEAYIEVLATLGRSGVSVTHPERSSTTSDFHRSGSSRVRDESLPQAFAAYGRIDRASGEQP